MTDVLIRAQQWHDEDSDPVTKAELAALITACKRGEAGAQVDLAERFTGQLQFGTAGLRGLLGAGPQRMNRVLVKKVGAGLAAYLHASVPDAATRGVVIGYDGRRNSRIFAHDTARVLGGAGLKVYIAHRPWSTPTCAWSVLAYRAAAGVMVTASHNPPQYNGYKVYWHNGAQIISPHDDGIAECIDKVIATSPEVAMPTFESLRAQGIVAILDEEVHERYLAQVEKLRRTVTPNVPTARRDLAIAYTPLHGVGALSVEAGLARAGFTNVQTEPSQRVPDGEFPTVSFPNPEEPGALDRVLTLATTMQADLVLANDPDADRLSVAIRDAAHNAYRQLSGDQVGALLADYLLSQPHDATKRMVATTIVSSQLLGLLAKAAGVDYRETLTGFKWIANAAMQYEAGGGGAFVMGYEEALGYSVGPLVRDKDGVSAAVIFAELVAWNLAQGRSVIDHLHDIYHRVGLFVTEQVSLTLPGSEGLHKMAALMRHVRSSPPKVIGTHLVIKIEDLEHGSQGLPASDVLIFRLENGHRVIMRPSGTEPKLKSYYEVRAVIASNETVAAATQRASEQLLALRTAHQQVLAAQP
jgi:phosphomannomutase